MVRSDEICYYYFPPIVSIPLPDRQTKSRSANRKLPPIVGPKSDMADYRRLPPIIIFTQRKFSHCPIFHPIFHPTLRSVGQWDARLTAHVNCKCSWGRSVRTSPNLPCVNTASIRRVPSYWMNTKDMWKSLYYLETYKQSSSPAISCLNNFIS